MINNLLVVCTGNICRSPMGWGLFKKRFAEIRPNLKIDSAGIRAVVGHPPTIEAQETMSKIGVDITEYRAKQLTLNLVSVADLILVMETHHKMDVINNYPTSRGKTFLLGEWSKIEISDPYEHSIEFFETTRQLIENCWNDWKDRI